MEKTVKKVFAAQVFPCILIPILPTYGFFNRLRIAFQTCTRIFVNITWQPWVRLQAIAALFSTPCSVHVCATAAPFSVLCSVHFCEAIATQFLQCCQGHKNYISLQFHVDQFTKYQEKNRETYFWSHPRIPYVLIKYASKSCNTSCKLPFFRTKSSNTFGKLKNLSSSPL